jgi:microcystin-dependent protein
MPTTPMLGLPYPDSLDTADVPRDIRALALAIEAQGVLPAGVMQIWPGAAAPAGWVLCDGQTVDAAANPKLAAIFGSAGGLVSLPNLKQRFPIGADVADMTLRAIGGVNTEGFSANVLPDHSHRANSFNNYVPMSNTPWTADFAKQFVTGDSGSPITVITGGNQSFQQSGAQVTRPGGAQQTHDNRPLFYAVNFIIKLG